MTLGKRGVYWVLLCLALGCEARPEADPELVPLSIGGDFRLTGSDGLPFVSQSLRGRTVLLFFGYTACPDVCPATMSRLARVYQDLNKQGIAGKVITVFISVDPERDSPEKLRQYLDYFAVNAIGLTGAPAQVADVAQKYAASYERAATTRRPGTSSSTPGTSTSSIPSAGSGTFSGSRTRRRRSYG